MKIQPSHGTSTSETHLFPFAHMLQTFMHSLLLVSFCLSWLLLVGKRMVLESFTFPDGDSRSFRDQSLMETSIPVRS